MATKLDLRKELRHLYEPPAREVVAVEVPAMSFLMVDGRGDPNVSREYQEAVEVLYGLAYALKFASKKAGIDYPVMPLEGLWWVEGAGTVGFDMMAHRDAWQWTMMIMQPDHVTADQVEAAVAALGRKKGLAALAKVRFERFEEGLVAQVMHVGPYSAEKPTIDRVHAYIAAQGCVPSGKHHEIYLGDPRRTAPEKLRTVIRQPMRRR